MSLSIDEALDFIHSVTWLGSSLGLSRVTELLTRLGNPEKKTEIIHIAGTNGKGSTAAMLSSILTAAGYKTGLYTSPYLFKFNERMKINNIPISDDELCRYTEIVRDAVEGMSDHPTEFELVTAIAFVYFAAQGCDLVVLEVGMGGRLDATNVVTTPLCSVITAIGLDHTRELGDTLPKIAFEKAGIVKDSCDTVLYQQGSEITDVVRSVCLEHSSVLHTADFSKIQIFSSGIEGQAFSYKNSGRYNLRLLGEHQAKNASVVLEVCSVLRSKNYNIPEAATYEGLQNTVWSARFEVVSRSPWFIVDGGHNPQCAETVAANMKSLFPGKRAVILIGVMADKDVAGLTDILDEIAVSYVTVAPNNPRALSSELLASHLEKYGKPAISCGSISLGVKSAILAAGDDGIVISVGSLFMAGDVRAEFGLF